jgi:ParB family transcriptional regulator, chromosome partitioning protein
MSLTKDLAAKAATVTFTADDAAKAAQRPIGPPRTAPGNMMDLQNKVTKQALEIAQLKEALQSATAVKLPVSRLHEVTGRRRKLTPEQRAELKLNLEHHPLSQAISVTVRPDGDWDIVAGNNRVDIYKELGREEILGVVLDVPPDQIEQVAFFSNLLAPSLSDFEKFWNFKRLQETSGIARAQIAEAAGLSVAHTHRIFAFDGLPEAALTVLETRPERLGSTAAQKLAAAASAGRSEAVVAAIKRLVEDAEFTQDQAVASVAEKAPRPPTAETLEVKSGKKKICTVVARNGVIGVRFTDAALADRYAKEIHDFLQTRLGKTG